MEKNSQSYNSTVLGLNLWKFLMPELPQLILYLVASLLLLLFFNLPRIWNLLNSGGPGLGEIAASNASDLYKAWHVFSNSNLVAAFWWGLLGCVIYLIIWFFRSLVTNIRNDLVVANYVHPLTYKEYLFWRSLILRKIFFGLSFIALLFYMFAGYKTLAVMANFGFWWIENGLNVIGYYQLVGIVVAGMLLLHGFTLILKITLNFWQFIYRDL